MRKFLQSIKVPITLLVILFLLESFGKIGLLPNSNEWAFILKDAIQKYGLFIIGPLAFFENLAAFNVYFPGSIVILTAMALSTGNPGRAFQIFLTYYIFAVVAYHIDYYIGAKLGRRNTVTKNYLMNKSNPKSRLWLRYMLYFSHPQLASFLCVELGSEGLQYSIFIKYLLLFTFIWTLFWSVVMYSVGTFTNSQLEIKWLAYIYLIGLLVYDIYKFIKNQANNPPMHVL